MRSYRDLLARVDGPAGSAWGEFGPDDELGTISRLTPERARAGATCVRTGEVFNLDLPLNTIDPPLAPLRKAVRHTVFGRNAFHRDDHLDDFYPQASSQIDGLRHMGNPDHGFYNGASGDRLVPGDPLLGIRHWAEHGIVGRGVLVDVERHRERQGRPIDHRACEPIPIEDVAAAAEEQGVRFEPGDLLLLRFGWIRHYLTATTEDERRLVRAAVGRVDLGHAGPLQAFPQRVESGGGEAQVVQLLRGCSTMRTCSWSRPGQRATSPPPSAAVSRPKPRSKSSTMSRPGTAKA